MKNIYFKSLIISLFLLAIPLRQFCQTPQFTPHPSTITFDITEISPFDERIIFMYNLVNDERFNVANSEDDGVFIVSADPAFRDMDLKSEFYEFREQNAIAFSRMDKEQASELAIHYKSDLPQEIMLSLMMEVYSKSRQNNLCSLADPFCTDNGMYEFPAGVNAGNGESGPNYACLSSTPNPAWYYMRIGTSGNINISMYSTPSEDIDFCCWGPFEDPDSPCPYGLTIDKKVSCSYSSSSTETCAIPSSALTGQYYILVITNFSNHQCNIHFSKTSGSGTTDCGIMPPLVNNDGPFCIGDAIHLTANGQQGASYHWTGPNNYSSNLQNPTITNCNLNHSGTYTCTISLDGQSNSSNTEVSVYGRPTANFTATTVCQGAPTQFTSTSTTNPANQAMTYLWDFGDGQTSRLQNPTHQFATAGSHNVSLTVSCGNGACSNTKTKSIAVAPQPVANAGTDTTIIYGASAPLSGSGGAGSFNYHWEPADKVLNPNAQNTQTKPLTAQQTFTLTVTSPQGDCSDSDQITVHLEGSNMTMAPTANPTTICEGTSSQLDAHAGGGTGNFTYSWTPTTGLSNPHIANPTASPTSTTTYTCTASDGMTTLNGTATVTVNHPEFEEETHFICPGDVYNFHGTDYSDADDYTYQTTTSQGCEKTILLHLRHHPSYSNAHTTYADICPGESYTFHGTAYNASGLYPHHLQTIHGCDSTVWLNLNVYPDYGVTIDSVTVCPEQLPYYFYGVPYDQAVEVIHTDNDIYGCDSLVKLVLSVNDYYMPDVEHQYIAYDDTPSFTWPVNGQTYTTDGQYIDTLPTAFDCLGIFRLDLQFMKAPEPRISYDTACDNHTWWISGTSYDFEMPQGEISHSFVKSHFDDLTPYHYADGRPCKQEFQLHLQMYKSSDHEADFTVEHACNSYTWQFGHNGESETYFSDGVFEKSIKSKNSLMHCDSIVTLTIRDMIYTPEPEIVCTDNGIEWPHHPITATEFNVNKYTYAAIDPHSTLSWNNDACEWTISKESWPIRPSNDHLTCDVYAMDWTADTIWLTFTAVNPCDTTVTRYYLKSSFYDTREEECYPAAVGIVPNPNDGQMLLRFENLEGRLSVGKNSF